MFNTERENEGDRKKRRRESNSQVHLQKQHDVKGNICLYTCLDRDQKHGKREKKQDDDNDDVADEEEKNLLSKNFVFFSSFLVAFVVAVFFLFWFFFALSPSSFSFAL